MRIIFSLGYSTPTCHQEKAKEIEARFAATKAAKEAIKLRELQEQNTKRVQKREAERLRRELELQAEAQAREVRECGHGNSMASTFFCLDRIF